MKVELCKHIANKLLGSNQKIVAVGNARLLYERHLGMFFGIMDMRFCIEQVAKKPDEVIVIKDSKGRKVKAIKRLDEKYIADIIVRKKQNGKIHIFHANKIRKKKEQQ